MRAQAGVCVTRAKQLIGARGQPGKERVRSDAAKPVLRIAVVAFAAVQDGVEKTLLGRLDLLHDAVGRVEMIVPEQRRSGEQLLRKLWNRPSIPKLVKLLFQLLLA